MTSTVKALVAVGTFGTIGGAGATTYYLLKDNSISIGQALKDKGHTLLNYDTSKDESTVWNPIVKAYSTSRTKFEGVNISITGGTDTNPTKEDINALKNACKKFIATPKDSEANLKIAEQFCVSPIAIKDLIGKNRTVLDSTATTDLTPELWNNKVNDYLNSASTDRRIHNIDLTKSGLTDDKKKRDELKKGCDEIGKKLTHDNEYHKLLSQFEEWCSNPK